MASDHKPFFAPAVGCLALAVLFAWIASQFYLPGKGFTYLVEFGGREHERFLPELRAMNHFEIQDATGYDGQYYAQIAMRPRLNDPALRTAIDSVPYRGRRILLSWIAWAAAGGDPVRALHLFAVENLISWPLLGILLWRWAPPTRWSGVARWAAVLFSFGLACSIRGALVDGPSLLLIAGTVALAERDRIWLAAGVLALAGLARETNLLACVALWPSSTSLSFGVNQRWAQRGRAFLAMAAAAAPLLVWLLVLKRWVGEGADPGARNFALPLAGYGGKWREIAAHVRSHGFDLIGRQEIAVTVGLSVQWGAIVLRPRRDNRWWRVGAVFAVLGMFLGEAVWEGYPGAAARVLLPLAAAFALVQPLSRARPWSVALFLIGNVGVLVSPNVLTPPGRESVVVRGPRDLRIVPRSGQIVDVRFGPEWYDPEKSWLEYWRWARAPADLHWENPHAYPVRADVRFGLRSNTVRTVVLRSGSRTLWTGRLEPGRLVPVELPGVELPPGESTWRFATPEPPAPAAGPDGRPLTFSIRDLRLDLTR